MIRAAMHASYDTVWLFDWWLDMRTKLQTQSNKQSVHWSLWSIHIAYSTKLPSECDDRLVAALTRTTHNALKLLTIATLFLLLRFLLCNNWHAYHAARMSLHCPYAHLFKRGCCAVRPFGCSVWLTMLQPLSVLFCCMHIYTNTQSYKYTLLTRNRN